MESILDTIKKMLGITADDTSFDIDVIMNINAAIAVLTQIGVGPKTGFFITDSNDTWSDFVGTNPYLELVKMDIYCRCRKVFDPGSSALSKAIDETIKECEWRLQVAAENSDFEYTEEPDNE